MSPSKPSNPSEGKPEDVAKVAQDAADTKTAPVDDEQAGAAEESPKPKTRARRKKATPAAEGTAAEPVAERERSEAKA